ncbi:MAG: DCC1-like thiol-disulfide oxidoreductase family protein [Candidatus Baltobacteraceae bacterium]
MGRRRAAVELSSSSASAVVLFDGVCTLCSRGVGFAIARDPGAIFRFAALQSEPARAVLAPFGRVPEDFDSIVLVDRENVFVGSDAALRIAKRLRGPVRLAALLLALPRPLRDAAYRLVARNRQRWFGRRAACLVPTPELATRFLT